MAGLFTVDGDCFVPSERTRGGWNDDHQHGSPPSGLLARAIERVPTPGPMQVARYTLDLFRPVPLTPLRVTTAVVRAGRRIQVIEARLLAGDVEVGRATALEVRRADLPLPLSATQVEPLPGGPDDAEPFHWDLHRDGVVRFHVEGVEIRTFDGSFATLGPGASWFRLRQTLIEGEADTPLVTLATIADLSNGNAQSLDTASWTYVNADLTLYAHRMPEGPWVGMRSEARQEPTGVGVVATTVFDERGPIGTITQAQVIDRV